MIWIGAIIGFLIGLAEGSFAAIFTLTIVGLGIGSMVTFKLNAKKNNDDDLNAKIEDLNQRLQQVEQQLTTSAVEKTVAATEEEIADSAPTKDEQEAAEDIQSAAFEKPSINTVAQFNASEPEQTSEPQEPTPAETETPAFLQTDHVEKTDTEKTSTQKSDIKPPPIPVEPTWLQLAIKRWVFGGNPLVKVGVLILFLGLAFLLRYAAQHTVFPVELRYASVGIAGIALLVFGWRWRDRKDNYGLILQGAGIAVLYLTTLAAMKLHPLIPASFGFIILFAVAGFAALLAVLQNSFILALVGTLGGFAAPVLASTGSGNHISLFSYLAVLNLGIAGIAWFKAWRALNLVGFICTFGLGSAWANKYYHSDLFSTTEPFLILFFVLYVLITFLFARRMLVDAEITEGHSFTQQIRQSIPHINYVDGTLAFGVPISAFWLQYLLTRHIEYGAAFSALWFGALYIALAMLLFRRTGLRYILLTETMIALGVVFGSLAIPLMDQPWTSAAWAVEAAGVYWIGIRQQRIHARMFALLLMVGSSIYYFSQLRLHPETVLDGSLLSCLLLSVSSAFAVWLMRKAKSDLSSFEAQLKPYIIGFAALFLGLAPLQILSAQWASPVLALMGAGLVYLALRSKERAILHWSWIYQIAASILFISTLKSSPSGAVLSNGWSGLFAASLIGISMLLGVWLMARFANDEAEKTGLKVNKTASVSLLAGLTFINLAPLFILPWSTAALIWPVTGFLTLFWAIRAAHTGTLLFALGLQVVAGGAHFGDRLLSLINNNSTENLASFQHIGFWGPILIALAAFACARLLQRQQQPKLETTLGWIALLWGGAWWGFAWTVEIVRINPNENIAALLAGITIVSLYSLSLLSKRWQWREASHATLVYVPLLSLIASVHWLSGYSHPFISWGAAVWPLALLVHGILLRRQSDSPTKLLELAHIVGVWLFVIQAALEVRWQFTQLGALDSAWSLLGWMLVPAIYLWALSRHSLLNRWPLRDFNFAYLIKSASPIIIYLITWVWLSNIISDGKAEPLPYIPILNPLEIAHIAVLLSLSAWWLRVRQFPIFANMGIIVRSVFGLSAFAIISGVVVRSCHHFLSIPWRFEPLFNSVTVQTSLSIVWSTIAILLMVVANRRLQRWVWLTGAGLMAVVVSKLFLIELASAGSIGRIVSFIVVGLLLLLVGYFAPLPPKNKTDEETGEENKGPS